MSSSIEQRCLRTPTSAKAQSWSKGDPRLFNQYELIVVNPQKYPNLDPAAGAQFANWIASDEGQATIAAFKIDGKQVFFPNAKGQH